MDTRRRRLWARTGALVLAVTMIGVAACSGGDDDVATAGDGSGEIFLEPASETGPSPFTKTSATFVPDTDKTIGRPSTIAIDIDASKRGGRAGSFPPITGSTPGLYGGSGSQQVCDADALVEFLEENADKAAAWAGVHGIEASEIASYVAGLTPVVLLDDTRVTNHGFSDGRATPRQSVLQAGTAVLVDAT